MTPAASTSPLPLVVLCGPTGIPRGNPIVMRQAQLIADLSRAVAVVELPLHGERGNPKLTPRLLASAESSSSKNPLDAHLWSDLLDQTEWDLRGALDVLAAASKAEFSRTAFVGTGLGAALGARFCLREPRVRACVLAGLTDLLPALDPTAAIRGLAPRPVLVCTAQGAEEPKDLGTHVECLQVRANDEEIVAAAAEPIAAFLESAA
jgi:pimeloyl-ACP methyl ester carboxylesterase